MAHQDEAPVVGPLQDEGVGRVVVWPTEEVRVQLEVPHAQHVEAALKLAHRFVRVVGRDEGDSDETVRSTRHKRSDDIVAAPGVGVEDTVDAGTVDAGGVHVADEVVDVVVAAAPSPAAHVCMEIYDGRLQASLHAEGVVT